MNKEEFESRVSALRNQMLAIAASKLLPSEAEDAVQNAVLSAWTHLSQLRDEKAFEAWIIQILVNECHQLLRKKKRQNEIESRIIEESRTVSPEDAPPISEALLQMKQDERELLLLHHEQGYSIGDIAKSMGQSESVVKMRLYRARKRLRIILISLLVLFLGMAAAVGSDFLDVPWFFLNRKADPNEIPADHRSDFAISLDSQFLDAEITDAVWDMDSLMLHFTYSLAGKNSDALTIHSGNIGIDGVRHDHIWIENQIIPVEEWAKGKTVYTYFLDGWKLCGQYLTGSEDYLSDGKGESFLASMRIDTIKPDEFRLLLSEDGAITIESDVFVRDYTTHKTLEKCVMTVVVSAPSADEWRIAYEEYYR